MERLRTRPTAEDGQGLAEYALSLALIAIVALLFLGGQISSILLGGRSLDLTAARLAAPSARAAGRSILRALWRRSMTRLHVGLGALLSAGILVALFALTLVPTTELRYARSGGCPDDDALVRTVPRSVSPG